MGNSTGPRTPRGKARSSQNAAKHWIESCRILPQEQKEATLLRKGLVEDFDPQGTIENEWIDDMTLNRLIKRRIDIAFTREFLKAANEKTIRWMDDFERAGTKNWVRMAGLAGICSAPGEKPERLRPAACISALKGLKQRIAERGPQPEDLQALCNYYGVQPTENVACAMHELALIADNKAGQVASEDEKEAKEVILGALDTEVLMQKERADLVEVSDAIENASDVQEPAPAALETLLRYRAANIREFKDLLDCFERIRRLRSSAA